MHPVVMMKPASEPLPICFAEVCVCLYEHRDGVQADKLGQVTVAHLRVSFPHAELGLGQGVNVSLEGCPEDQGPAAAFSGMYVPCTQLTVQL